MECNTSPQVTESLSLSFSMKSILKRNKDISSTLHYLNLIIWSIQSWGMRHWSMKVVLPSCYQWPWSFSDIVFNVNSIKSATTHCKYLALWMTVEWKLTVKLEDPAWAEGILLETPSRIHVKDKLCGSYHLNYKVI